jgi:hypothetical protein
MSDEKFAVLQAKLARDPAAKKEFQENPLPQLEAAGIPLLPAIATPPSVQALVTGANIGSRAIVVAGEEISVNSHWWGIDVVMNEKLTQDIITGLTASGALGGIIGGAIGAAGIVTGGVATVIGGAIALIIAAKTAEVKIVDNGKGVHWPISWPQWAALIAALPMGVAGIVAAGMAFIHPLRN